MNISIENPGPYYDFCEKLFENYKDYCFESFAFLGVQQAAIDLTTSLAQLFSHKMSIALYGEMTPNLEKVAIHYSRLGFTVQRFEKEKSEIKEWVDGLKKDTLFCFFEEDNSLTGEINNVDKLVSCLDEKKVFSISVSYNKHMYYQLNSIKDNQCKILVNDCERVSVLVGKRFKARPLFAPYSCFWEEKNVEDFSDLRKKENKDLVLKSEKAISEAKIFFSENTPRIYDRAVLIFEEVDGSVLVSLLSETIGHQLNLPMRESLIETSSLCRWTHEKKMDWISSKHQEELSPQELQGLVVFSLELLERPGILSEIQEALDKAMKLQGEG